jgi:hypothetical protein
MLKNSIVTLLILFSSRAYSLECTAHNRHVNESGVLIQSESKLITTLDTIDMASLEGELYGQLYFLTYNKQDEDGLLQIVDSADNTKGIVARSSFNKKGFMSLTLVDNQIVHRLECFK